MWSAPVVVTPAASEPISLDEAKEFLRVEADETAFDTEIGLHIAGARGQVEAVTGTRMFEQVLELKADSFADLSHLPVGPVIDVVSVTYIDTAGAEQTIASTDYELFGAMLEQGIRPVVNGSWPTPIGRTGAVTVQLTAGYGATQAELPGQVVLAMLLQIRALFDDTSFDIAPWLVNHRIWA